MGGLALYDGDQYVCHLWDRKHFDEYIDPTDRQFRRSLKDNGFEMRVAVGIEKQLGFDEIDLDLNNELSEKCHEGYERADAIIAKELRAKYSCLLEFLLARGYINLTEDEIKDKGHADALSKSIAIVQTSWFILQCFARAAQGLDVTAIEVVTFAFAVLNFVTYFLWWNKPLRVRHPVRVYWMPYPRNNSKREVVVKSVADMKPWEVFKILFRKLGDTIVRWFQATRSELRAAADYIAEDYKALSSEKVFFFLRYPQRFPIFAPLYPIAALCTRFRDLGAGCESDDFRYLFSSRLQHDPPQIYATVYMAAVLFAAIHCVPWFFHFPTAIEQLLWRISAFLVTVAPIVFLCLHLSGIHILRPMVDKAHRGPLGILGTVVITSVGVFWILLISSMYIFYVGARLALIILALTTLRDLPRDGYEAVDWNKFLPHIG
ncbi:hypothetical protein VNI00_013952 [Paramarasmius palmivorus]|uniref:Uncharacterized protein n=1 Tax=Paramarasmius palmivorus TaxID=297713 RepID=A0AAW0BX35_9AGAR